MCNNETLSAQIKMVEKRLDRFETKQDEMYDKLNQFMQTAPSVYATKLELAWKAPNWVADAIKWTIATIIWTVLIYIVSFFLKW